MPDIFSEVKKNKWFKMGKWKEPVIIQDSLFRGIVGRRTDIILGFGPSLYVMFDFKQYAPLQDFHAHVKEAKAALQRNPQKISHAISFEVARAVKTMDKFVPESMNAKKLAELLTMLGVLGRQSYRFMIMGYALQELYLESLPDKFHLAKKTFTPQMLLAKTALPKKLFPMIHERYDLLKLSVLYKRGKNIDKLLSRHADNYGWMNSLCWWDEPFDSGHYMFEIKQLMKGNPSQQLRQMKKSRIAQYREAKRLLQTLRKEFPIAWNYIDVIRSMTDGREESWDSASTAGQRLRPWLKNTATRLGLTYDQFMAMSVDEMLASVTGKQKIAARKLQSRIEHPGVATSSNRSYVFGGKDTLKLAGMMEPKTPSTTSIKGMPVWLGKVRGRAYVAFSVDELKKMRPGQILVCPMTDPDFMPAIRKAGALVTDQGGVLCHAAIVARELQKTCIVGTQIATKIFKTGDLIEVDANKGIVQKLKSN